MTKRVRVPRSTEAYGWVGMWLDGLIGWRTPEFVHSDPRSNPARPSENLRGHIREDQRRVYLCKITIEPVFTIPQGMAHRSQPITRIVPFDPLRQ